MNRVTVKPELLRWARHRSGKTAEDLGERFAKLSEWEAGARNPTFKQLEKFAKATHTPVGYLFLDHPPQEDLPIPDFRTVGSKDVERPSADMLDTIYDCQRRQDWYRSYARAAGSDSLPFVGSASTSDDENTLAATIRDTIDFDIDERAAMPTWTDALREFRRQTEDAGVLVMVNGVVGNDPHRTLNPQEFRGFCLVDDLAPLVFINGHDSKAAQMFTLAHELAHLWLGETGLDDAQPSLKASGAIEAWCNGVAAELLAPLDAVRDVYDADEPLDKALDRLVRHFKVSSAVMLRRIHDLGALSWIDFQEAYDEELAKTRSRRGNGGGDFHRTLRVRVGDRFARAIVTSTVEGRTLYRDAFRMLGLSSMQAFENFANRLEAQ